MQRFIDWNGDGYEELVSWTQWPTKFPTIEVFKTGQVIKAPGKAPAIKDNYHCYNEHD